MSESDTPSWRRGGSLFYPPCRGPAGRRGGLIDFLSSNIQLRIRRFRCFWPSLRLAINPPDQQGAQFFKIDFSAGDRLVSELEFWLFSSFSSSLDPEPFAWEK